MPHLGTQPPVGFKTTTKQSFSGDNSTTAFTLNRASSSSTDLEVFVDNIQQEPITAYSVSGTTLTFTEAPPTGTNNVYVVNRGGDQNGLLPPQDLGTTDYIFGDDISFNSDGAVINFGADSDINLTHVADTGLTTNNDFSLKSDSSILKFGADEEITLTHVADTGLTLKNAHTTGNSGIGAVLTLQTGDTDMAAGNAHGSIRFQAPDEGTGTDAILEGARIQAAAEGDFSSSSNATKLQFFASASGVVGSDPGTRMELGSDGNLTIKDMDSADGSSATLTLQTGDTDIAADDILGTIDFQAPDEANGTDAILVAAGIEAVSEGDFSSSSNATSLVFKTGSSEAATEKVRINSSGFVGIGTNSPQTGLQVEATDGSVSGTIRLTATGVASSGMAMDANGLNFGADTGGFVFKTSATANDPSDTGTTRMSIASGGDVTISDGDLIMGTSGHGISFAATGDASESGTSMASELLDDYEEGTFTPGFSQSGATIGYSSRGGIYTKIGNMVYASGRLFTSSISGGSGNIKLGGLPFTPATAGTGGAHAAVYFNSTFGGWSSTNCPKGGFINDGDTLIDMRTTDSSDARDQVDTTITTFNDTSVGLIFTATYRAS